MINWILYQIVAADPTQSLALARAPAPAVAPAQLDVAIYKRKQEAKNKLAARAHLHGRRAARIRLRGPPSRGWRCVDPEEARPQARRTDREQAALLPLRIGADRVCGLLPRRLELGFQQRELPPPAAARFLAGSTVRTQAQLPASSIRGGADCSSRSSRSARRGSPSLQRFLPPRRSSLSAGGDSSPALVRVGARAVARAAPASVLCVGG